jgi:hypothetical protein
MYMYISMYKYMCKCSCGASFTCRAIARQHFVRASCSGAKALSQEEIVVQLDLFYKEGTVSKMYKKRKNLPIPYDPTKDNVQLDNMMHTWECKCGKSYSKRQSLFRHKKTCQPQLQTSEIKEKDQNNDCREKVYPIQIDIPHEAETKSSLLTNSINFDRVITYAKGVIPLAFKKGCSFISQDDATPVVAQSLHKRARYSNVLADITYGRAYCFFAAMISCFPAKKRSMQEGEEDIYQGKKDAHLKDNIYELFYTTAKLLDCSTYFPIKVSFFSRELGGVPPALAKDSFVVIGVDKARVSCSDESKYVSINDNSSWAIFGNNGNILSSHRWKDSKKYRKYLDPILELSSTIGIEKGKFASSSELYVYNEPDTCPITTAHEPSLERNKYLDFVGKLNPGQRNALVSLTGGINRRKNKLFFLEGPAGSGKSSVLNAFISYCYGFEKGNVSVVTSTGMAASLYNEARTAHSAFAIPWEVNQNSECDIQAGTPRAARLKYIKVLVWDECVFNERYALEAVEKSLRKFYGNGELFGGLFILFAGDFRQILPITENGTSEENTIKHTYFWNKVAVLSLEENMRARNEHFANFVLEIGNGECDRVTIPKQCKCNSLEDLIGAVFPEIIKKYMTVEYENRAILSTLNDHVDIINNLLLSKIPELGRTYSYKRTDMKSVLGCVQAKDEILVKIGCPYMVLKNINYIIYNGTRGVCIETNEDNIKLRVTTGVRKGEIVTINRVQISPTKSQFPITPCFAITINKSQGQTLEIVGIYLPVQVFAHGQLYVAFSRVGSLEQIKIFSTEGSLKNVVSPEILKL